LNSTSFSVLAHTIARNVMAATAFGNSRLSVHPIDPVSVNQMFGLAALLSLIAQVSGTPYISGGDTPAGTDCSGLASWVANVASGRPAFGSRFNTGNIESSLLSRGFHYGSAPNSVVIGWNGGHAAVTLPDGTPVSSGESGRGVRVGGGGAYQSQFNHHMYLPVQAEEMHTTAAPADPADPSATQDGPEVVTIADGTEAAATEIVVEPAVESVDPGVEPAVESVEPAVESIGEPVGEPAVGLTVVPVSVDITA
jgi:hypothetical protein